MPITNVMAVRHFVSRSRLIAHKSLATVTSAFYHYRTRFDFAAMASAKSGWTVEDEKMHFSSWHSAVLLRCQCYLRDPVLL